MNKNANAKGSNFKIGDKIKILRLDHIMEGNIATIRDVDKDGWLIVEFPKEIKPFTHDCDGFFDKKVGRYVDPTHAELVERAKPVQESYCVDVEEFGLVRVIHNQHVTVAILFDGTRGVAKCQPSDSYNKKTGFRIALARAQMKFWTKASKAVNKTIESLAKEVENLTK